MKLRQEFQELLHEELLRDVGDAGRGAFVDRLQDLVAAGTLTRAAANELETLGGVYAATLADAAFVAGLVGGADLRRLLCE